jgi:hypothetical protein
VHQARPGQAASLNSSQVEEENVVRIALPHLVPTPKPSAPKGVADHDNRPEIDRTIRNLPLNAARLFDQIVNATCELVDLVRQLASCGPALSAAS